MEQIIRLIDLCTNCAQVITNPICPHCFSQHILIWARDKNLPVYEMNNIERGLRILVIRAEENVSDIKCILCGLKKVNLCFHCFTNKAQRIIERNTNEKLTGEFNESFNTKIWRI